MASVTSKGAIARKDAAPIPEIDVLWLTAGLGCDGDTIADWCYRLDSHLQTPIAEI